MRRPRHHDPHERVYDDWISRFFWFAYHLGTLAEWLALVGDGDYEDGGR